MRQKNNQKNREFLTHSITLTQGFFVVSLSVPKLQRFEKVLDRPLLLRLPVGRQVPLLQLVRWTRTHFLKIRASVTRLLF